MSCAREPAALLSNLILHPPSSAQRSMAACFAVQAVRISESACSGAGLPTPQHRRPPPENTVSCSYKSTLSTGKQLLIDLTWQGDGSVHVAVCDASADSAAKVHVLRRKKGSTRPFAAGGCSACTVHWDLSAAKYGSVRPEPEKDFFLAVAAGIELALHVGDAVGERIRGSPVADFAMCGRRERVFGATHYATMARFRAGGGDHEVMIRCKGGVGEESAAGGEARDGEVYVCVDRKRLVSVRSVGWNFRGNQTVYVGGAAVDVLWDVHDWWFPGASAAAAGGGGAATFLFRTRSDLDSKLWSEEEMAKGSSQFTLLIQAFKN